MIEKLQKRLDKIEKELGSCRTSSFTDGWQTQKHARKARKWDILAQEKMKILAKIDYIEYSKQLLNPEIFE